MRFGGLLAVFALAASTSPVSAGMLVEAVLGGMPLRLETGQDRALVLASFPGGRRLIDVERRHVYLLDATPPRRLSAGPGDDGAPGSAYLLEHWSPGPPVAGHASTYHVLQLGETICGEVLASGWMAPFVEPLVRAIELLERLEAPLRPVERGECGAIPFAVYARNGWPLQAGWQDEDAFLTRTIRFDHYPDEALFARP